MYSDNRRSAFCESGGDKDKCFPYSILSKQQQQLQQLQQQQQLQQRNYPSPPQPPIGQSFRSYQSSVSSQMPPHSSINIHPPSTASGASFYGNTMVTDVGICFSMSNVNLNSDYSTHLGHPSLSVLGKGYGDAAPAPTIVNNVPPPLPKYRSTSSAYKSRNLTPPSGIPISSSHSSPSTSPYSLPYSPYYFAYPKIPVKIYNNRAVPYVPLPTNTASSASAAAAYGQQLNSYFGYPAPPPPAESSKLQTKFRRNASKNLMDNQYYEICMTECSNAMKTMLNSPLRRKSPPQQRQQTPPSPLNPSPTAESPIHVDVDDSFAADQADDERNSVELPPLPPDEDDDDDGGEEPQDFSMKPRINIEEPPRSKDSSECFRRTTAAPKKKWIRQHMNDEPLVNGHSTAPPLVVISTNGSSSNSIISSSSSSIHQKQHHAAVSSLTIDLSTKSNSSSGGSGIGHRLSSTPPSSGCSSSSSTLTISPVDDSQSSLNLSGGSTSGYITSHSANSSSSLNLSGSSPGLSINGGSVIGTTSSHGPNSSPLPHDLVIVQQQQQQQIGHLVQAGQPHHGLMSTTTLLNHIPTGGRRRTTSSNSNGVGTREVHNKLEKNRRAHLKECFEQLKKQLTLQPDEKKTSNLSILHAAIRHIQLLKRKEREYEHEMERLAKEKIASQNRILLLKRELSQWGDVDFSRLAPDTDAIPNGSNNNGSSSSSSITSTSSTMANSNGVLSDRDLLNDPPGIAPGRNGIRYSSSSSLSSVATTASIGNLPLQTTISPVLIAASSPSRASPPSLSLNRNSSSPAATSGSMPMPLSLTTKSSPAVSETHNSTPSPLKFSTGITSLPNGLNLSTSSNGLINGGSSSSGGGSNCSTPNSINGGSIGSNCINGTPLPLIVNANNIGSLSQSQLFTPVTATILTTGNGTALQTLPLNLNVTSSIANGHHPSSIVSTSNGMTSTASGLQIIGTTANGTTIPAGLISSATGKELINGTTLPRNGFRTDSNKIEIIATQSAAGSALEPPATKVIKLVNGNTLDKMMLSQVVQQGGLVMSPIQLLTPQGLRVIQQAPNGLATIELSTPANVQPQSNQTQRTTGGNSISSSNLSHLTSSQPSSRHPQQQTHIQSMTGAQLHKLLISSTNSSTSNGITTISSAGTTTGYSNGSSPIMTTTITPELARLPGGAELNILPAGTNGATALPLYRTTGHGGKLTFVNAISTGNGTGLTLKGTDTSTSGTGRTAVHVVTPIQTSTAAQLSGLTPVVVSRYDQDTGHVLGSFTTSTAGPQQTAQLGKVVKAVGQSPSGLPLIAATPNAQYLNAVFSNNSSSGNGAGPMMPLPPLVDGSGNLSGPGTPSLVLVNNNNSKTNSNQTPPPMAMVGSNNNGEVTAAVAI